MYKSDKEAWVSPPREAMKNCREKENTIWSEYKEEEAFQATWRLEKEYGKTHQRDLSQASSSIMNIMQNNLGGATTVVRINVKAAYLQPLR